MKTKLLIPVVLVLVSAVGGLGCTPIPSGGGKVDAAPVQISTETLEALGVLTETDTLVPMETMVPTATLTPKPTFTPMFTSTLEPLKPIGDALKDAEKHSILKAKERLDLFMPAEWICEVRVTGGPWREKPSQEEMTQLAKDAGEKEDTASNPIILEDEPLEGYWVMLQFLSGCPGLLPYVQDFVGENIIWYFYTNTYYVYLDNSGKKVEVPFVDVPKSMYWNKLVLYWSLGEGAVPAYFAETAQ